MREDSFIVEWWEGLAAELGDVRPFDVHLHTGATDPDGFRATDAEVIEGLERIGARGAIFPFHSDAGYTRENDRVIAEAAASEGRLVAFCRVNPRTDDPAAEAARALDAGAVGIKLHPRAEAFTLGDPALAPVIALADERRLPVLVHAGRGIPALGRDALAICESSPGVRLILAHAGISDLSWLWPEAAAHPNLFFDTSWWSPADLLALLTLVPPGQVLNGSDAPYGTPLLGAVLAARCGLAAGLDAAQVASVMGGQAERLVAGDEPLDAGPAPGRRVVERDVLLDRIATFLDSAIGRIFAGDDAEESIALTQLACEVPADDPTAGACAWISRLCDRYREARAAATPGDQFPGAHVVLVAACAARTTGVALPAEA